MATVLFNPMPKQLITRVGDEHRGSSFLHDSHSCIRPKLALRRHNVRGVSALAF